MGRPPTRPKRMKDGFYIEVRNKGASMGMKIRSDTEQEMMQAAAMYSKNKEVVVPGEHKNDVWYISDKNSSHKLHMKPSGQNLLLNCRVSGKIANYILITNLTVFPLRIK